MNSGILNGKVALVTGASRGIGRAVAVELARQGAQVIAVARSAHALSGLVEDIGPTCSPAPCELGRREDVKKLAAFVRTKWGRLDILVANAAIMGPRTMLGKLEDDEWREVIDTNVTANWRLIRHFDALLRDADAGRAVFVTSGAGSRGKMAAGRGAYAISKAALDALARSYATETEASRVRVMLCNPGPLRTELRASIAPDEDPMSLRTPADFAPKVLQLCLPTWRQTGKVYDFPQDRVLEFRGPE
ncbi:MAG: SDR family oxidoreductase [Beijerinckiaceae bacterium]|nr:SDR family oxidoreductase [Beijerinckiaceae bacterium]